MRTVSFHSRAETDVEDAGDFLDRRVPGLDAQFFAEVGRTVDRLLENPRVGLSIGGGVRRISLRRFPYHLIYRAEAMSVFILAVVHHRQDPDDWRTRL